MQQPVQQRAARPLRSKPPSRATKTRSGSRRKRGAARSALGDDENPAGDGAAPHTAKICAAILRESEERRVLLQKGDGHGEVGGEVGEVVVQGGLRLQRGGGVRRVQLRVLVEEVKKGENRDEARRGLGPLEFCGGGRGEGGTG